MKKTIIALTISSLGFFSATAYAVIPGRFCMQIKETSRPVAQQIEVEVIKTTRQVSSIIGKVCYIGSQSSKNLCVAALGDIIVESDGTVQVSLFSDEQIEGTKGTTYATSSAEFDLDPITLKGQGTAVTQTTDGKTQTFIETSYSSEIVTCPTPTRESISESKQLKSFIRNASKR